VVLAVEDTGIGITPQFLPYVFDRFSQADGTVTRRHGGLGLGMAIVRYLVELHGGTVKAQSDGENQGATFTIVLPATLELGDEALLADDPPSSVTAALMDPPPNLDGVSVLIVDDDPDSRTALCHLLEDQGASVAIAGSTADALDRFRQLRPDVLVSDIGMPDEDGYALIRRVRALSEGEGGSVPAIALTAYVRPEDSAAALTAGYHRHVSKPVDIGQLIATIAELVVVAPAPAD
jgi:CheY-like chemotaxis protein